MVGARAAMAFMMLSYLPMAAAFREQGHLQTELAMNQSTPNLGLGIQAVSKYAGGNCQFMPAFDVAAFLVEEAPAAAKGVGMLAKPAVTAVQVATKAVAATKMVPGAAAVADVVTKGAKAAGVAGAVAKGAGAANVVAKGTKTLTLASKAGLLGKVVGGALSLSNPIGIAWTAFQVGTTAYQLYELQKVLKDPSQLCAILSDWVPPYDHALCLKNQGISKPHIPLPELPSPPAQLAAAKIDKRVVLAAAAVLMASSGGLALWHRALHSVAYDQTICPRDMWLEDPTLVDWYSDTDSSDSESSSGSLADEEEDQLGFPSAPMPRWVSVPTSCQASDLSCQHRSCQQACCDDKNCSLYQFDESSLGKCWLGQASLFTSQKCEQWVGKLKVDESFQEDPRLYQQVMGLKKQPADALEEAKLKSCGRRQVSDEACAALICEDLCREKAACQFYQLRAGHQECWLGTSELATGSPSKVTWHGGLLDAQSSPKEKGCEDGFFCPATQACVEDCKACSGFTSSAEGRCRRTSEEGICDPNSWQDKLGGTALNSTQCKGLERVVVKMSEETGFNGHAICQEACCSDPACVMYQVRSKAAQEVKRKAGDTVHCWLGLVDSSLNHLFKCGGGGWVGDRRSWEGGFLSSRGCPSNAGAACLMTGECVQSCASQCPGAEAFDADSNACVASAPSDEKEAIPVVATSDDSSSSYYISTTDEAAADTLLMVTQNKHRLIETVSDDVCQTLSFGAKECKALSEDGRTSCSCSYPAAQTCSTWFKDGFHLRPVISEAGMLLLAGEGCDCFDEAESAGDFVCHFENLQELPLIKTSADAETALRIP